MSLTSELEAGGWAHAFFAEHLPGVTKFVKREGKNVAGFATKVELGDRRQASTIGTAFDYRLRLHLGFETTTKVLRVALLRMEMVGSGLGPKADRRWAESMQMLLDDTPKGSDDMLAKASVVMAWLDQRYRHRGPWPEGMVAVARQAKQGRWRWEDVVSAVETETADEVEQLMRVVRDVGVPKGDAVCGPEFAGTKLVGGADADLVIDRCLYDVKTLVNPRRDLPKSVRQVIGYALLDWDDQFEIERVGFYFARQGKWISWLLTDLIGVASGTASISLSELRQEFHRWAVEHGSKGAARKHAISGDAET